MILFTEKQTTIPFSPIVTPKEVTDLSITTSGKVAHSGENLKEKCDNFNFSNTFVLQKNKLGKGVL